MPMASLARRPTVSDRPAPGTFDPWARRPGAQGDGGQARHSPAELRRAAAGDARRSRRRRGVRRPDGRKRHARLGRREIEWLETPLAEDKPLLGLCLGAQMLARALGARVFGYDDKRSEIGYYPIEPTSPASGYARPRSRARSTNGIPTASICPTAPSSSPLAGRISPTRPIATAGMRSVCSSTQRSPIT